MAGSERRNPPQQAGRDPRRADRLATGDALDDRHEIVDRRLARHVSRHARLGAPQHVVLVLDHPERDHAAQRGALQDDPHDATALGHGHIDQNDISLQIRKRGQRLVPASSGGDDAQPCVTAQNLGQSLAVKARVGDDRDADHGVRPPPGW